MRSINEIANALFGGHRAESQDVLTDGTTHTYTGVAVSDSEDGVVLVDLGGDVTLPDDLVDEDGTVLESYDGSGVEVPTGPSVRAGDSVVVTVVGGSPLREPMVTSVPGEGDRVADLAQAAKDVADAINQYFWTDTNGAHVTSVPQSDWEDSGGASYHSGPNVIINSLGQLFRNGLNNLLALTGGTTPGVAIYDGAGNADGNVIASFVGNLIELGRNSLSAVIKLCSGTYTIGAEVLQSGLVHAFILTDEDSEDDSIEYHRGRTYVESQTDETYARVGVRAHCGSRDGSDAGKGRDYQYPEYWDYEHSADVSATATGDYSLVSLVGEWLNVNCNRADSDVSEQFSMRRLIEVLKMAKTAGDSWTMHGYRATGYVTNGRTEFACTIATPYRFFGATGVTLSGTYTVRQNGGYHFGSTSSTPASLTGRYSATVDESGYISVNISTGAEQTGMVNNDPASVIFNSLTIALT